jgi:Asparagine synthase
VYFTLGISAASRDACAALVRAARDTDPRVMPIPGPAYIAWSDERTAILHWGPGGIGASYAGTIWADHGLRARTGLARIDPVYLAETPGAVVVSDRAGWAAAVTGRLENYDPVLVGALVCLGYPTGAATAFRGVRALGGDRALRVSGGRAQEQGCAEEEGAGDPGRVAAALVEAVRPLAQEAVPVELSLTGGKDSRLIAAALAAADVPFRARTHGSARHPDVVIAGLIAERLGVEHTVTEPRAAAGTQDRADVLSRVRSAVLVSDGMLSAFENVGGADGPVQIGGHGGELLRGGYAQGRSSVAAAELFRRLITRRLSLLRPAAAAAYLGSLAPWAATLAAGPLRALDDFYLVNRAGRWSAAARQAYLIRSPLVQPFFSDRVIRAARAVPLPQRMNEQLHRDVLAALRPDLLGLPLAGHPRHGEDWRRSDATTGLLREYVLGQGQLFGLVSRRGAERALGTDPQAAWALASLATLLSGDWRGDQPRPYLVSARQK